MGDDFTVLTGLLCAAASTRMIDGGNNKRRYRFQGGAVGVAPRTIQSSAQNVAAGISIFTCKEQNFYGVFVVVVVLLNRGSLPHSFLLG